MRGDLVRVGVIGTGGQAKSVHLDGYTRCPQASIVALCDTNAELLADRAESYGVTQTYSDYHDLIEQSDVDAVSICTPNCFHKEIALAAISAGKHVLCENPLAMTYEDTVNMYDTAERAGVRHMTAFTYRFVPAMRYLSYLVRRGDIGPPLQLRSRRLQDWGNYAIGWRQIKAMAGSGGIGDMASHRIDYAHLLIGQPARATGLVKTFLPERITDTGERMATDVEDWTAFIVEYHTGAVGVFESAKMAFGRGSGGTGHDEVEISGPDGSFLYELSQPHTLRAGKPGSRYTTIPVPDDYLRPSGAPPGFDRGDPLDTFRYQQSWEFITAIAEGRSCTPSFYEGMRCQAVIDAVLQSAAKRQWVDVAGSP